MKKKIFLILLLLVVLNVYKTTDENITIPSTAIRLRVIPNSNSPIDINIKEKVKKYLENNIYILTNDTEDIAEARTIISDNISSIENNIDNIFKDNNYLVPYQVNFGYNYFPEKTYKGIKYKEGYYESLVIALGDANGDNWWCVLFPNFCLIDTKEEHEYKSYIKELLTKYSKKNKNT